MDDLQIMESPWSGDILINRINKTENTWPDELPINDTEHTWPGELMIQNRTITPYELGYLAFLRRDLVSPDGMVIYNFSAAQSLLNNETFLEYFLTSLPRMPTFNKMSMIKTVVLSLMFLVALVGNSATLVQMYRMRRRKSTINLLILHLAIADLIVTFFAIVSDAIWTSTVQWFGGNFMCKLIKFLQVFGLYLSTYIIVIISLDRCLAILDPMSRNKAPRRVRVMVVGAWVASALFSTPQVSDLTSHCSLASLSALQQMSLEMSPVCISETPQTT